MTLAYTGVGAGLARLHISLDAADEGEAGTGVNDTTATATPLTQLLTTGSLTSGDVDYFSVVATEGSRILVMMDHDPDGDGQLTTDFGAFDDYGRSVALQSDGKILAAGYSSNGNDASSCLSQTESGPNENPCCDRRSA